MDVEIMAEGVVTVLKLRSHHKRSSDDRSKLTDRRESDGDTTSTLSKAKVL